MKKPNCPHCQDIPVFGCVACPRKKSKLEVKLEEKLDEIKEVVDIAFTDFKSTLQEEARKRYDALLKIRGIIRGVKMK